MNFHTSSCILFDQGSQSGDVLGQPVVEVKCDVVLKTNAINGAPFVFKSLKVIIDVCSLLLACGLAIVIVVKLNIWISLTSGVECFANVVIN
jgi:hypothetical protein